MKQYINKSVIVTEIEKWRDGIRKGIFSIPLTGSDKTFATFEYEILGKIMDFIDTIKVNEVDFEKELERLDSLLYDLDGVAIKGTTSYLTVENIKDIAKYFFELGLNERKGGEEWKTE